MSRLHAWLDTLQEPWRILVLLLLVMGPALTLMGIGGWGMVMGLGYGFFLIGTRIGYLRRKLGK